ncbi:MAG: LAGLIDADG family homing endonuclease [Hadesarchaea archaeon]|nr:LAGLIDADG family homing endonuclease [Hadesarchaea archaeon]
MQHAVRALVEPHDDEARFEAACCTLCSTGQTYRIDLSKLEDPAYDRKPHAQIRVINGKYRVQGSRHVVTLPTHVTEKLALFTGLLYGDGSLINPKSAARQATWRIDFAEGDKEVVEIFARLGKEIFDADFKVQLRGTWYVAYTRNKVVYRFLSNICGHPAGRKTGRLHFPKIFRFPDVSRKFLSGLFSTEGTVYLCYKAQPRIVLTMQEEKLVKEIHEELMRLGFKPTFTTEERRGRKLHRISLYGLVQAKMFKEKIGFVGAKNKKLEMLLNST